MQTKTEGGWIYDDGGRALAGFKGSTRDCVCRAIAIVEGRLYSEVYADLNAFAQSHPYRKRSSSARGVHRSVLNNYLEARGWCWTPTMKIGQGCRVHLRPDELPSGRLIVRVSRHVCAVIDGTLHDTHDCSRDGTRCVYGYWSRQNQTQDNP